MVDVVNSIGLKPVASVARAGAIGDDPAATGQSFMQLVEQFTKDAIETSKVAEKTSMLAAAEKAELLDVVTAVSDAEVTLQTVIAIRDRVIQAYQEIIKMPI